MKRNTAALHEEKRAYDRVVLPVARLQGAEDEMATIELKVSMLMRYP
jgi:hypothetical protein